MEKCCGFWTCPCYASRGYQRGNKDYKQAFKNKDLVTEQPKEDEDDGASGSGTGSARGEGRSGKPNNGEFVQRITHDDREDEMNENLGIVHDILGDLKAQAEAMGEEIDDQNAIIAQVEKKTNSNTNRVDAANKRAQNLTRYA